MMQENRPTTPPEDGGILPDNGYDPTPTRGGRLGITAQVGWVTHISSMWVRTEWTAFQGRSLRVRSLAVLALLLLFLTPSFADKPLGDGSLTEREKDFLKRIIFRWGHTDLARKWIDKRLDTGASAECDLLFFRADCYKAEANADAYSEEIKKLQRRCPSHPRAQAGTIELMKAALLKIIEKHQAAVLEGNASNRKALFAERDRMWDELTQKLETGIVKANDRVKSSNEAEQQVQLRDTWEHYRVQASRVWARLMPQGSADSKASWEKVLAWATAFVDDRWQNFAMQCECQLWKSEALARLGKTEEAAEEFDLLVEMSPPSAPPFPEPVIYFLRWLRLQAITGTAQAWNGVGQMDQALKVFERVAANKDDPVELEKAIQDPKLVTFVIDANIEEAIARCAAADDDSGVELFLKLIAEHGERELAPGEVPPYRLKVARGAARLIDSGCGLLPAIIYEYAGIGHQVDGNYRAANFAFKRALRIAGLRDGREARAKCASLLDRIGQTYYQAGSLPQAAASFHAIHEAYRSFGGSGASDADRVIAARASQNAYSILGKLDGSSDTKTSAWEPLKQIAEGVMVAHADLRVQKIVAEKEGLELEQKGDYRGARRVYQQIPREDKHGKLFPGYVDLAARSARALFLERKASGDAEGGLKDAVKELDALEADAKAASSQTFVIFTAASLFWDETVRDPAKALERLERLKTIRENDGREQALHLWITILISEKNGDKADEIFAIMKSEFADSVFTLSLAVDLIQLHLELGSPADKKQAAELASFYIGHKDAGLDKMAPNSLLFFGKALVDGGKVAEAKSILERAEQQVTADDVSLSFAVKMLLAKVQLASGEYKECVALLKGLEAADPDIAAGTVPDGHLVYQLRATARLELYKGSPKAELLEDAAKDTKKATGLLQRIALSPGAPAELVRSYWESEYSLLKIYKAQKEWERVIKTVKMFSGMGSLDKMPADLKANFERIQAECEKK
ncbi:MAG: hypothetical protein AAF581_06430 [Planctomycetota bacterium]